jgi:hypothetical protein
MTRREPDVEMTARVKAKEVRFECVPEVELRAYSNVPATAEHSSERDNLPDSVEAGVTCRDIEVRWRLAAHLEVLGDEQSAQRRR